MANPATKSVSYVFAGVSPSKASVQASITVQVPAGEFPHGGGNLHHGYGVVSGNLTVHHASGAKDDNYTVPESTPWWGQQVLWENPKISDGGSKDGIQVLGLTDTEGWCTLQYDPAQDEFQLGESLKLKLVSSNWSTV